MREAGGEGGREGAKTGAKMWAVQSVRKHEIGYVIYIAVLLRERRALESFRVHFLHCM